MTKTTLQYPDRRYNPVSQHKLSLAGLWRDFRLADAGLYNWLKVASNLDNGAQHQGIESLAGASGGKTV